MNYIDETFQKNMFEKMDRCHAKLLQLLNNSTVNPFAKSLSSFSSIILPALCNLDINNRVASLNNIINTRNDSLFKTRQLTFVPYQGDSNPHPPIPEVFKKIQSKPLAFFISITDGWYNVQVYESKKWKYLESKKSGLLWYEQAKNYPWVVALERFADRFEKSFEKLKEAIYIVMSNFKEANDRYTYKKLINSYESVNDGYRLLYSDNEGLEKFYPSTSIFYLGWENLVTIVPTARGRISRIIPSMGIGNFLFAQLPHNYVMTKHCAYLCKRMLTEESDEQADAIGVTDHRVKIPLGLLKDSLKKYLEELSPALPDWRSVRFEGWFNSRLFQTILLNYGFSTSDNLGLTNILNPWHSILDRETTNGSIN